MGYHNVSKYNLVKKMNGLKKQKTVSNKNSAFQEEMRGMAVETEQQIKTVSNVKYIIHLFIAKQTMD